MKLQTEKYINIFKNTIRKCKDDVWLISATEKYNLKSELSQIVAIGKVAGGNENLELFTSSKSDERYFLKMFNMYPEML